MDLKVLTARFAARAAKAEKEATSVLDELESLTEADTPWTRSRQAELLHRATALMETYRREVARAERITEGLFCVAPADLVDQEFMQQHRQLIGEAQAAGVFLIDDDLGAEASEPPADDFADEDLDGDDLDG